MEYAGSSGCRGSWLWSLGTYRNLLYSEPWTSGAFPLEYQFHGWIPSGVCSCQRCSLCRTNLKLSQSCSCPVLLPWKRTKDRTGKVGWGWGDTRLVSLAYVRGGSLKSGTVLVSRESKYSGKMVSARRATTNTLREQHAAFSVAQPAGMCGTPVLIYKMFVQITGQTS